MPKALYALGMFVRVKSTANSPRRSVQVVRSVRTGDKVTQRIVRYMGIALDDVEELKLRAMAQEFIERTLVDELNENSLFDAQRGDLRPRGRPARQSLASVAGPSDVRLADVLELSRRVEGPHEVLGALYDYLRFDRVLSDTPARGRGAASIVIW